MPKIGAADAARPKRVVAPWLDNLLTALFFTELAYMSVSLYYSNELVTFLIYVVLSGAAIELIRKSFEVLAVRFSK